MNYLYIQNGSHSQITNIKNELTEFTKKYKIKVDNKFYIDRFSVVNKNKKPNNLFKILNNCKKNSFIFSDTFLIFRDLNIKDWLNIKEIIKSKEINFIFLESEPMTAFFTNSKVINEINKHDDPKKAKKDFLSQIREIIIITIDSNIINDDKSNITLDIIKHNAELSLKRQNEQSNN